ncbi:hypothetical protein JB92DRAFT_3138452 [Gautieria morchelliformis]|nr:hypothetical protein JB92DRAFT_3138452 [Gautieria morchelliformis]
MRSLAPIIIENGHLTLEALENMRLKGYNDESTKPWLDRHFDRRRTNIERCIQDDKWREVYYNGMKRLVNKTKVLPPDNLTRFLDVGCCPGGYSKYMLKTFPNVRGVGISLEEQHGGYPLRIGWKESDRYEMHWGDLSFYDICRPASSPHPRDDLPSLPLPFGPNGFQLVILDAHRRPLPGQEATSLREYDRLLMSQLIVGLQCVDPGGTLIITLKDVACLRTAQILYMLDEISKTTVTFKDLYHQGPSGVFHAIATGIGLDDHSTATLYAHLERLKAVWWELTYGGEEGKGRELLESDLHFIVDHDKLAETYLARLKELGKMPWRVQESALKKIFHNHGQRGDHGAEAARMDLQQIDNSLAST